MELGSLTMKYVNSCFSNSQQLHQALHPWSSLSAYSLSPSKRTFPAKESPNFHASSQAHACARSEMTFQGETCNFLLQRWLEAPRNFPQWRIGVAGRWTQPVLLPLFSTCIHGRHVPQCLWVHWEDYLLLSFPTILVDVRRDTRAGRDLMLVLAKP